MPNSEQNNVESSEGNYGMYSWNSMCVENNYVHYRNNPHACTCLNALWTYKLTNILIIHHKLGKKIDWQRGECSLINFICKNLFLKLKDFSIFWFSLCWIMYNRNCKHVQGMSNFADFIKFSTFFASFLKLLKLKPQRQLDTSKPPSQK